jgi:hypothetical protein
MKTLLCFALTLISIHTLFAQNAVDLNGIPLNQFPETTITNDPEGVFKASKRLREFSVNQQLQKDQQLRLNDVILLNLFQNKQYKARIDKLDKDVNGTFSITARLSDLEYGWCFISTSEGKSYITIEIPEKDEYYVTRYNPKNGKYYLLDMDKKKMESLEGSPSLNIPEGNSNIAPGSYLNNPGNNNQNGSENNVSVNGVTTPDVVSVMIVYTPSAASWAATYETSINNTISSIMQKSNLALGNSNSLLQFELVYSGQVDYTELNTSDDLYNLTGTTDGYMDNVHSLRNTYGADVVVLLENVSFTGGIGWLLNSTAGSPSYAFSITRVQQASWTYTTVHEVGHNMGCHHAKNQNFQPGPGIFTYSAGWRWTGTDGGQYCSVMTYESGTYFADGVSHTRVPYFSNPSLSYQGVPTGDAVNADNARTLRETKSVVAAYRTAPCTPPTEQSSVFTSSNLATGSMTIGWTRGNGSNVLVVARQGSAVSSNPVNGTSYSANPVFGSGTQIGTGNYVVYNGTGNTVSITGLSSGTVYHFAIYEYNVPSNCYLSPALTGNAMTLYEIPAAPVAQAASNVTQTGFQANWNASSGATGYFLDVSTSNTFDVSGAVLTNQSVGNVLNYTVGGLVAGTTYYYRIRASNLGGTSGSSNVITMVTLNPAPPVAPVPLAASGITQTGFQANWNVSSGATGYFLDVSTSNTFDISGVVLTNQSVGNVLNYNVGGLVAGTTYYYRVRAANAYGTSANSSVITVATLQPPAPAAPGALAASNISQTGFNANWNLSANATGYYLDVSTSSAFSGFVTGYNNRNVENVTTFTVTGLAANTTYYYRIRAYNAAGTSANSARITVKTLTLTAPLATAASNITKITFSANWSNSPGATGYYLDVATTVTFNKYVTGYKNKNIGNVTTATVTGLSAGKTYYYRVRAFSSTGTSANSNTITVLTPASDEITQPGWINQPAKTTSLTSVYPNPFNDKIAFSYTLSEEKRTRLEIFDITGRLVKTLVNDIQKPGFYQMIWDATGYNDQLVTPGIYVGKFSSGEYSKSAKLVFQGE